MRLGPVLVVLLLAGCAGEDPTAPGAPARPLDLACAAPCATAIDDGPTRAFEPVVAVHPRDARHVVVVHSPFGPDATGLTHRWLYVHVSRDGGATWSALRLPGGPGAPLDHPLAGCTDLADPYAAFASDGTLVVGGMALRILDRGTGVASTPTALFTARSPDGGATFEPPVVVAAARTGACVDGPATEERPDRPTLAAGPDGRLALAWLDAVARGTSLPRLVESADGAASWAAPVTLALGEEVAFPQALTPAYRADGSLFVAGISVGTAEAFVATREGDAWNATILGGAATQVPTMSLAVVANGSRELVVAAWGGMALEGDEQPPLVAAQTVETARLARSPDGGATWSAALDVEPASHPGRALPAMAAEGRAIVAGYYVHGADGTASYHVALLEDGALRKVVVPSPTPTRIETTTIDQLGHYTAMGLRDGRAYAAWIAGGGDATDLVGAALLVAEG